MASHSEMIIKTFAGAVCLAVALELFPRGQRPGVGYRVEEELRSPYGSRPRPRNSGLGVTDRGDSL